MRFLILILISSLSFAVTPYRTAQLDIHAKVFPKILLADTKLQNKLVEGAIKIIIFYSPEDSDIAHKLKTRMHHFYPKIKNYPFIIVLQKYKEFDPKEAATAYYQLLGEKESLILVNSSAQERSLITFSFDSTYLNYGTVMSLHMGKKVSPYISIDSLKKSGIVLDNIIYKVAKIK